MADESIQINLRIRFNYSDYLLSMLSDNIYRRPLSTLTITHKDRQLRLTIMNHEKSDRKIGMCGRSV